MFDGPSRTWLAGSLEDLSDVTGDCCDNMRVRREENVHIVCNQQSQIITFNPSLSSYQALTDKFSAGEEKMAIQSVFYAELVTGAVQTVMKLKQGKAILSEQVFPIPLVQRVPGPVWSTPSVQPTMENQSSG